MVQEWVEKQDPASCLKLQQDLLATYRDDFHKYGGEMNARLLADIMLSVSRQLGNKFVYSLVDPSLKILPVKKAFSLLFQAKVCSKVLHTTGNGLPLGMESNTKFFKALMLDIGLVSAQLGRSPSSVRISEISSFRTKGNWPSSLSGSSFVRYIPRPWTRNCFTGRKPGGDRVKSIISFNMGAVSFPWK